MSHSRRFSGEVPRDRSRDSALDSSYEGRSSSSASWSTCVSEEPSEARSLFSPVQRQSTPPRRQPVLCPQTLGLRPTLPSSALLPLAQSTPTSSAPSPLEASTSRTAPPPLPPLAVSRPPSAEGQRSAVSPPTRLSLYVEFKKLVAAARREARECRAGGRPWRLRTRSSNTPDFFHEFPTNYKSKQHKRKKAASESKRLLTGKPHWKGQQAEWSVALPTAAKATAAATPSAASDGASTSKSTRSPSAATEAHAVGVSHQQLPSTATSAFGQARGGSVGKSAPARHSTEPRKERKSEASRRKEPEAAAKQLAKPPRLSPCKVVVKPLPSSEISPTGRFWRSPGSEGTGTNTSPRDVVSGPPAEGQRDIPLSGELVKKRRKHPPLKSTNGGQVKRRRGHPPLKGTILDTASKGVGKKTRGQAAVKAAILNTTSGDKQTSLGQRTVKSPVHKKALKTKSPQKNKVLPVPANTHVTSDLALSPQKASKASPKVSVQKPKSKSTAKSKVPSSHKQASDSGDTSKHRKKHSEIQRKSKEGKVTKANSKPANKRRIKISVATAALKTVSASEPTAKEVRQRVSVRSLSSMESSPEKAQTSRTVSAEVGEASAGRRSRRSAALLARQAIISSTALEQQQEVSAGMKITKESDSESPPWKLSSGSRHPICWPPTSSRSRSRSRSRKARVKRQILPPQEDVGPSGSRASPSVTNEDSVTTVSDEVVNVVDSMDDSMDSVDQEIKHDSNEKVDEFSGVPSVTPSLNELSSPVQEPQTAMCHVDAAGSITTATTLQTSSTTVTELKRGPSSQSQADPNSIVATSTETIFADVGLMSGQVPEPEWFPQGRCSSLECVSTSYSSNCGLLVRSRSYSPPAPSSLNLDKKAPEHVIHCRKQLAKETSGHIPQQQLLHDEMQWQWHDDEQQQLEESDEQQQLEESDDEHQRQLDESDDEHQWQLDESDDEHQRQLEESDDEHQRQLEESDDEHQRQLEESDDEHQRQLEESDDEHQRQLEESDDEHQRQLEESDDENQRQLEESDDENQRQLEESDDDHQCQLEESDDDHQWQLEESDDDHQRQLEQSEDEEQQQQLEQSEDEEQQQQHEQSEDVQQQHEQSENVQQQHEQSEDVQQQHEQSEYEVQQQQHEQSEYVVQQQQQQCDQHDEYQHQRPVQYDQRPVQYDQRPVQYDQRPVQYDQRPVQYDQRPVQYDQHQLQWRMPSHEYKREAGHRVSQSAVATHSFMGFNTLPPWHERFHMPWTGGGTVGSDDNFMPLDLSMATARNKSSVSETADQTADSLSGQETSKQQHEPAGESNLPVACEGFQTLPSWSSKFDVTWTKCETALQEYNVVTTPSESSVPGPSGQQHEHSTVGNPCPLAGQSFTEWRASSGTNPDLHNSGSNSENTSTASSSQITSQTSSSVSSPDDVQEIER